MRRGAGTIQDSSRFLKHNVSFRVAEKRLGITSALREFLSEEAQRCADKHGGNNLDAAIFMVQLVEP